jgi:hypothetical protein
MPKRRGTGGAILAAAWRAALLAVAGGAPSATARASLDYLLEPTA